MRGGGGGEGKTAGEKGGGRIESCGSKNSKMDHSHHPPSFCKCSSSMNFMTPTSENNHLAVVSANPSYKTTTVGCNELQSADLSHRL